MTKIIYNITFFGLDLNKIIIYQKISCLFYLANFFSLDKGKQLLIYIILLIINKMTS